MRTAKVFISHSTKNDDNLAFLNKVYDALKPDQNGQGFDVLVDRKKLQAGDKWHYKISEWMHECDAAIILLTDDALKSDWVKAESTVVAVRDRIETDFKLIPVLLSDITAECITSHPFLGSGSAAHLDENQFENSWPDQEAIISNIKNALAGLEAITTPFDRIGDVITQILKEVDEQNLQTVWQELDGTHKPTWQQGSGPFADTLMRYLFRQQDNCLNRFKDILDKIRPKLSKDRAQEFLNYIRALWVDSGAAACLPATAQQKNKMAVINGRLLQNFTFQRYVERAWPLTNKYERITISEIDEIDKIQEQMRDHFQAFENPGLRLEPEECDEEINDSDDPVVVCMQTTESEGGLLDYRMRRDLKAFYPNVIFLMGTGDSLPVDYPEDILGIEPALNLQNEREQMLAERKATRFLKKYCGTE